MDHDSKRFGKHVSADRNAGAMVWVVEGGARALIKIRLPLGDRRGLAIEVDPPTARSIIEVLESALRDFEQFVPSPRF